MLTANTVYDVFMALPETEKQHLVVLVNQHKFISVIADSIEIKGNKKKLGFTKKDAVKYLLENVFSKK